MICSFLCWSRKVIEEPKFSSWTRQGVEQRIVEAAETLMLCPKVKGPAAYGNSMPDPLRSPMESYGTSSRKYYRRPDAAALDRMEECWQWINCLPDNHSRRLVYDWARAKCAPKGALRQLAARERTNERGLRRQINRIFITIANQLNASHAVRPDELNAMELQSEFPQSDTKTHPPYWRTPNGRPSIDSNQRKSRLV